MATLGAPEGKTESFVKFIQMKKIKKVINFIARPSVCYWLCFLAGCLIFYFNVRGIEKLTTLSEIAIYVAICWFMSALAHINFFRQETELKDWTTRFILWLISPLALLILGFTFCVSILVKHYDTTEEVISALKYLYKELFLWM